MNMFAISEKPNFLWEVLATVDEASALDALAEAAVAVELEWATMAGGESEEDSERWRNMDMVLG